MDFIDHIFDSSPKSDETWYEISKDSNWVSKIFILAKVYISQFLNRMFYPTITYYLSAVTDIKQTKNLNFDKSANISTITENGALGLTFFSGLVAKRPQQSGCGEVYSSTMHTLPVIFWKSTVLFKRYKTQNF